MATHTGTPDGTFVGFDGVTYDQASYDAGSKEGFDFGFKVGKNAKAIETLDSIYEQTFAAKLAEGNMAAGWVPAAKRPWNLEQPQ